VSGLWTCGGSIRVPGNRQIRFDPGLRRGRAARGGQPTRDRTPGQPRCNWTGFARCRTPSFSWRLVPTVWLRADFAV